jgi:hypothetical protein
MGERQRPRGARLFLLRRDNPDIVGKRLSDFDEAFEPARVNAVIVGA